MGHRWKFVLVDDAGTEQDLSRRFKWPESQMQPASESNQSDSSAPLSFPVTASYDIHEGLEYWGGMADEDTGEFVDTLDGLPSALYGGYLVETEDRAWGARHRMPLTMVPYSWDLDTTRITLWPDPADLLGQVPHGNTLADWLTGDPIPSTSYTGLLPTYLAGNGGILTNIDGTLGALIFDAVMPGTPVEEAQLNGGAWAACLLRKALDDLMIAARFAALPDLIEPVIYMDAVIDPDDATKLRPRFNLVDALDVSGSSVATFAKDPAGAGEYYIEQDDFAHHRDDRDARQRILVKGKGTEAGALVMAEAYDAGRPRNGTRYQTDPGRAAVFINEDLGTIAECQAVADLLEAVSWGGAGWVQCTTKVYFPAGSIITLRVPEAGFGGAGQKFRVTRVQNLGRLGTPKWRYFLGTEPPDLASLFSAASHKIHALAQLAALRLGTGLKPGAPAATYATNTPLHSQQNVQRAARDGVTLRTTDPAYVAVGDTRTAGTKREVHRDAAGNVRQYIDDETGVDGIIRVPFDFAAAGTITWLIDDPGVIQRILLDPDTVTVTLDYDGSPVAPLPPIYGPDTDPDDPPVLISSGDPLPIKEWHKLAVTVDGACQLTLSGREALV